MKWHNLPLETIYQQLNSSANGLTEQEATKRLELYGQNVLTRSQSTSFSERLLREISDPMNLILFGVAILSAVLGEWGETIIILGIILINIVICLFQEHQAQNALLMLRKMTIPQITVLRNRKKVLLSTALIVPGDVIYMSEGDILPADLRFISVNGLKMQESALTGESLPLEKEVIVLPEATILAERTNSGYAGTTVLSGNGIGIVTASGMHTELGKIAHLLEHTEKLVTPMRQKLASIGKLVTWFAVFIIILLCVANSYYQQPWLPLLIIASSLAISIIPEGLPTLATITMAFGVKKMVQQNALVRSLPATETLGGVTVVCSDKTGTLTQNQMKIVQVGLAFKQDFTTVPMTVSPLMTEIITCGLLCNNATYDLNDHNKILGDPTEQAFLILADQLGYQVNEIRNGNLRVQEIPFSSENRCMNTFHQDGSVFLKGALDQILNVCSYLLTEQGIVNLDENYRKKINFLNENLANKALRILALAKKNLAKDAFIFLGLVGMIDPPKPEAISSIQSCQRSGIKLVMITGDHPTTALAIAKQLGLSHTEQVLTGQQIENLSAEQLSSAIEDTYVFARISPHQKLLLVQAYQKLHEVVAMTGDGVNDAPALKAANIGIAMGSGTEVAKEAADVVLLDNNFATIISAIKEGRRIYQNLQKIIQYLLSSNIAEMMIVVVAMLTNRPSPLTAVQILLLNLITDTLPALGLGLNPAEHNLMEQPPCKNTFFDRKILSKIFIYGTYMAIIGLITYHFSECFFGHNVASTVSFYTLILTQNIYALDLCSNSAAFCKAQQKIRNQTLEKLIGLNLIFLLAMALVPFIRDFLNLSSLSKAAWLIVVLGSIMPILLIRITKKIMN